MKITVNSSDPGLSYTTRLLLRRMLSPLCGFDQRISFLLRSQFDPRVVIAGAELAGVHVLNKRPKPKQGSYHIGGSGIVLEEAVMRALGETVERYAQLISEVSNRQKIIMARYDDLLTTEERVVAPEKLNFFSGQQYSRPGFPFQPFRRDMPMGWVKAPSLLEDSASWVPAQLVLVGYTPKHHAGEGWIWSGVTTGSAAHTKVDHALRNALLELIQIDSAMGHWYSSAKAVEIGLDPRTKVIEELITKLFDRQVRAPKFYWLQNADLAGMSIACVIKEDPGKIPAVAIGLGADLKLVDAMYKALSEAIAVAQLAKVNLFYEIVGEGSGEQNQIDPSQILDLDQNVCFYALPGNSSYIDAKFGDHSAVRASELPPDSTLDTREEIRHLVDSFRATNKELVYLDLTTDDIKELGFVAVRVWSPDTISLPLPSAPPLYHLRFKAYGGATHENPHPYP